MYDSRCCEVLGGVRPRFGSRRIFGGARRRARRRPDNGGSSDGPLVSESGQTLEGIVGSVKKVSDIIAELAAGSREQLSGIEQVNRAVSQLDEMTQQNAALVEEASAASKSMAGRSQVMAEMLERYRLGQGDEYRAASGESSAAPLAGARRVA